jgi:ABC-type transporter Mla maintaining outer membrane lipid asymmetry ATPase subunit MlaF
VTPPVLEVAGLVKQYHGLRPLRLQSLVVEPGESVAILGLDAVGAEVLINLLTGTMLPEAGEVRVFGQSTGAIADSDAWLRVVDRFGMVSARAVLLESLSVVQNLAMPFSLDIEPPSPALRARAVALAAEVGLVEDVWDRPVASLDAEAKVRVRLGRAVALDPAIVLLEHPSEGLDRARVAQVGRHMLAVARARGVAALTLTADAEFAAHAASRVLIFEPASGRLVPKKRRRWPFGK